MAKKDQTENVLETVESSLSKTELWIEENRNLLGGVIGAILVIAAGIWGYQKYILEPAEQEAANEIFMAQKYFEQDSLKLALNGDGQYLGFIDIADEYSNTKSGNLANYYAGISYLHLGDFENAISYLDQFDSDDQILSVIAKGAIGDAFLEINQPEEALEYYEKATQINENEFVNPIYLQRAANTADLIGNHKAMLGYLKTLKEKYPDSREAIDVDKWIAYAEAEIENHE
ncbi:MAG: tetratricopeptide repeat protein [Bacteroidota bacterium]|nr:tetratricopeptide repeat protein [Bacteroidota bacterium]MDX5404958.1 tetratricopeptide repeat protein [Bacteroidota bacterium]MDX5427690.1 tetratricopeptide repeat protein [Bacteroidota bacterium]MDX5449119.1 tetratricopeptide repeat protein [Bacteroidota bacterium]MDX5505587.1 tetratricopeptide repeat protein [Bacteroidota bacterium]